MGPLKPYLLFKKIFCTCRRWGWATRWNFHDLIFCIFDWLGQIKFHSVMYFIAKKLRARLAVIKCVQWYFHYWNCKTASWRFIVSLNYRRNKRNLNIMSEIKRKHSSLWTKSMASRCNGGFRISRTGASDPWVCIGGSRGGALGARPPICLAS